MQVRNYPAINVMYKTFQTTLLTLHDKIGTVARDLYAEAARQHLLVTGPVYWLYYGADGNPETEFKLEIAIPLSGTPALTGEFLFRELPEFRCLSDLHTGSWTEMGHTYSRLIQKANEEGLAMNDVCREIYINIDFTRDDCNLTEVQLGLR